MFQSIVEAVYHYANVKPEALCLADDFGKVSYKEYADKISRFATCFKNLGLKKEDSVVVEACQTIDYLAIELALQVLGIVFVPVEHNCASEKIQNFINRAEAKMVVTVKEYGYQNCMAYTFDTLVAMHNDAEAYVPTSFPNKEDVSEMLFSTGTTGKEKGIVIMHKNNVALAENVMHGVNMQKDNVEMIPSPMNHSHGLRRYYANMYNGCAVVLLGSVMNVMRFFKNIDEYDVNSIDLVPAALTLLLKLSKNKFGEYKDRLRYIQYGSAPLLDNDKAKICELLPNTRMYNFYGSTESGCTCIYDFNNPISKKSCIGKPTYNTTLYIVNDDRQPIQSDADHTGYLATAGDMNMREYWQDAEETNAVLIDGIVYSNDVGYIDEDGEVILLGRKGDVINVGGNKVAPEEIETVAKTIAGIADCGCIPVSDASLGMVPKLFVQLEPKVEFDPISIRSQLASQLEPYKVPKYIVEIDRIPRSFNGKLLRKELKKIDEEK